MKVFLSWSGDRSRDLANALREYLPLVIQSVTPWFSCDIDKGSRWLADLTDQLEKQSVAIVCVTPECVNSPWLLFEAGALSKALDASWVCPVLLDIEPSDIKGPLAQFQATRATKDDIRKLLATLNKRLDTPLTDSQIDRVHDSLWGDFEEKIKAIAKPPAAIAAPHRSQPDMLAEVLERVRGLERQLAEFKPLTPLDEILNSNDERVIDGFKLWKFITKSSASRSLDSSVWQRLDDKSIANHLAGHFTPSLSERKLKFQKLQDACLKRVRSLEEKLQSLPEENGEEHKKVEAELESERVKLNSYTAEIDRANTKLARTQGQIKS